jgi:hypothetical protein
MPILNWFTIGLPGLIAGVITFAATPASALDPKVWEASTNPETKERFIPVELWSGA